MKSVHVRPPVRAENPTQPAQRNRWPEAALSVAMATSYAYLVSFLYQYGQAAFYGYPPEYGSTSQQWVLFVASVLVLGFGGAWLSGMLVARGLARSLHFILVARSPSPDARTRRTLILLLVLVVLLVATVVWAVLTSPPYGRVIGVVSMVTGIALIGVWESLGSPAALKWGVVAAFSAMALAAGLGYGSAASATGHYRIVGTNLLVLAVDGGGASWVVAPYDPATKVVSRRYSILRSTESSPVVIDYVATGRLTVAPLE